MSEEIWRKEAAGTWPTEPQTPNHQQTVLLNFSHCCHEAGLVLTNFSVFQKMPYNTDFYVILTFKYEFVS